MGSVSLEKGLWLGGDPVTAWDIVSTSKLPGPAPQCSEVSCRGEPSELTARAVAVLQNSVMMIVFNTSTAED